MSYERARHLGLAERFYERILEDSRIAPYFANTDFARQTALFEHGVYMLIIHAQGRLIGKLAIERLGELHSSRHMAIPPELYPTWVERLIETLREVDPEFDGELEAAWRADLAPGIALMTSKF